MELTNPEWIAVGLSGLSIFVAIIATRSSSKAQGRLEEIEKRNTAIMDEQKRLDQRAWADAYFKDVKDWATEVCCLISQAIHLTNVAKPDQNEVRDLLTKLSAAIDTGRWYFPKQYSAKYGTEKPPAYRGIRQEVMDRIVEVYRIVDKGEIAKNSRDKLTSCQRSFVSHIQTVLDPRAREREINKVLEEFASAEKLRQANGTK